LEGLKAPGMNPVLNELGAICVKSMTGQKGEGTARSDECTLRQSLFVKGRVIGFSQVIW